MKSGAALIYKRNVDHRMTMASRSSTHACQTGHANCQFRSSSVVSSTCTMLRALVFCQKIKSLNGVELFSYIVCKVFIVTTKISYFSCAQFDRKLHYSIPEPTAILILEMKIKNVICTRFKSTKKIKSLWVTARREVIL